MIELNQNVFGLKPSATLAINQKIRTLRDTNEEIYHFGFGQSPFPIHESISNALIKHASNNHYLPTVGLHELRRAISNFLKKHQGIESDPDLIFIGPGSKELLYQTILILEGTFLIPKGSWVSYGPQIKSKGDDYVVLNTDLGNQFKMKAITLDNYCSEHPSGQKTLIINSPNNPTGAVYNETELKSIAEVCRKHNVIVLSDEIYSQINFTHPYSPSISKFYPEKTIVFGGLSKVFSAGGYRLGFMSLPNDFHFLHNTFQSLFSETFSAVASPVQYAAVEAYNMNNDLQDHIRKSVEILKFIADYTFEKLIQKDIECTKAEGAFYMMIGFSKFRRDIAKLGIENSTSLGNHILENYNVALLPSSDFYFRNDELFFRLAFVDFDGSKALAAYKHGDKLDELFIHKHCTHILKGINQLIKFIEDLK